VPSDLLLLAIVALLPTVAIHELLVFSIALILLKTQPAAYRDLFEVQGPIQKELMWKHPTDSAVLRFIWTGRCYRTRSWVLISLGTLDALVFAALISAIILGLCLLMPGMIEAVRFDTNVLYHRL